MKILDDTDGGLVIGYAKAGEQEYSRIYSTKDGCETWAPIGEGPVNYALKGALFTDADTLFLAYHYNENVKNNLFVSHDGGKSFSEVVLPEGKFDEGTDEQGLNWADVFKEATTPMLEQGGNIVVYLTQGEGGSYLGGQAAAKYVSRDNGNTWEFVEIVRSG